MDGEGVLLFEEEDAGLVVRLFGILTTTSRGMLVSLRIKDSNMLI